MLYIETPINQITSTAYNGLVSDYSFIIRICNVIHIFKWEPISCSSKTSLLMHKCVEDHTNVQVSRVHILKWEPICFSSKTCSLMRKCAGNHVNGQGSESLMCVKTKHSSNKPICYEIVDSPHTPANVRETPNLVLKNSRLGFRCVDSTFTLL